jgi:hypothetical protein
VISMSAEAYQKNFCRSADGRLIPDLICPFRFNPAPARETRFSDPVLHANAQS